MAQAADMGSTGRDGTMRREKTLMLKWSGCFLGSLLSLTLLTAAGPVVAAPDYPRKAVKIIVGAGPDIIARVLAEQFTQAFGQQVVVEQVPGAGGVIAAQTVARARPDGYTILFSTATFAALQAFRPDASFNLSTDFEPIGKVGAGPATIFVNPSLGVTTLAGLLQAGKDKPGKILCASSGPGTQAHLGCEMLRTYGKADIVHVPYNGMNPALIDTLSGRAQVLFGFSIFLPYVKDGKLIALATTGPTRMSLSPDVPTTAEAGLPQLQYTTWYGLNAPKGTPRPIIDRLNAALVKMLADPVVKQRVLTAGFETESSTPEEFAAFIASELVRWKKIVQDTGVQPE
jgi:tripartite-type tricarboxylate transporter receptor subunit TctC